MRADGMTNSNEMCTLNKQDAMKYFTGSKAPPAAASFVTNADPRYVGGSSPFVYDDVFVE